MPPIARIECDAVSCTQNIALCAAFLCIQNYKFPDFKSWKTLFKLASRTHLRSFLCVALQTSPLLLATRFCFAHFRNLSALRRTAACFLVRSSASAVPNLGWIFFGLLWQWGDTAYTTKETETGQEMARVVMGYDYMKYSYTLQSSRPRG